VKGIRQLKCADKHLGEDENVEQKHTNCFLSRHPILWQNR